VSKIHRYCSNALVTLRTIDSWKNPFKPFSIEFKPLLDEIATRETALRGLANGAAMVEILGKRSTFTEEILSWFPGVLVTSE